MPPKKIKAIDSSSHIENIGNLIAVTMFRITCAALIAYAMLFYVLPKFSLLRLYVNTDRKLFGFMFSCHMFAHFVSPLIYKSVMIMSNQLGDSSNPRKGASALTGLSGRLHSMHQNLLEGYAGYFGSILMSTIMNVPLQRRVDAAFLYSLSRFIYCWSYASDCRTSRTISYFVGQCSIVSLFMAVVCRH